jgi:YVTN family beta-propeller protein
MRVGIWLRSAIAVGIATLFLATSAPATIQSTDQGAHFQLELAAHVRSPAHPPTSIAGVSHTSSNSTGIHVADTLVLFNNTLIPGNFLAGNGHQPFAVAFDSASGQAFVADSDSNLVSVVSMETKSVVATIPCAAPEGVAYDGGKNEVYVTCLLSHDVEVISGVSDTLMATIPIGAQLWGITYDRANGEIFAADDYPGNNVSVINDTNNSVVATISLGQIYAGGLAYDNRSGEVFVANQFGNHVLVISAANNSVVANVSVGSESVAVTYDSGTNQVFVGLVSGSNTEDYSNVSVIAGSNNTVVAKIPVGRNPQGVTYDNRTGEVFVADSNSDQVSVISDTNDSVFATVYLGDKYGNPVGLDYDSSNRQVIVTNSGLDTLSLLSDETNSTVGMITLGTSPNQVVYDGGNAQIQVVNQLTDNLTSVDDRSNSIVASAPVGVGCYSQYYCFLGLGDWPVGAAYDAKRGETFVANALAATISVVNDTTESLVTNVNVSGEPIGLAYDSGRGEIFVADWEANQVTVISDTNDSIVATVPIAGDPEALVYDSEKGEIFVAQNYSANVTVISDATNSVVATISPTSVWEPEVNWYPTGLAYDSAKNEVFSLSAFADEAFAISDVTNTVVATIGVGTFPVGIAYDNYSGDLFVANYDSNNVSVISDSSDSVVATLAVGDEPTSIACDPVTHGIYVSNFAQGTLSLIPGEGPRSLTNVTFLPAGLGSQINWTVLFNGASKVGTGALVFSGVVNGTYPFSIAPLPGLVAYPSSGNLTVNGFAISITITFYPPPPAPSYFVTFQETGLPLGIEWYLNASGPTELHSGSTATAVGGMLPNGTYNYTISSSEKGYQPSPSAGSFTVSGAAVTENVTFQLVVYSVTFSETGLPSGIPWSVTLNGTVRESNGSSATFEEPNGTFGYNVTQVPGYTLGPTPELVTVAGRNQSVALSFSVPTYQVIFSATGLPRGVDWTVEAPWGDNESNSTDLVVWEPNGTYKFNIQAPNGYTADPSSGTLVIAGAPTTIAVNFTIVSTHHQIPPPGAGIPDWVWILAITVVFAVVLGIVIAILGRNPGPPVNP